MDIRKLISKVLGISEKEVKNVEAAQHRHISKHSSGKQRPLNFDAKRKTRRKMAKSSRRINRRML